MLIFIGSPSRTFSTNCATSAPNLTCDLFDLAAGPLACAVVWSKTGSPPKASFHPDALLGRGACPPTFGAPRPAARSTDKEAYCELASR